MGKGLGNLRGVKQNFIFSIDLYSLVTSQNKTKHVPVIESPVH